MKPSLSFIVPTAGRKEIETCLASVVYQLSDDDEVIVVADTVDGPIPETEKIVSSFGPKVRLLYSPETQHTWGHREINYGIQHARGDWLGFNDDDDVWVPGIVEVIREQASVADDRPILFKFLSYHGLIFWTSRTLFMQDQVGGHCIVCRNIPGKVGKWADHYQGDWSFIESTVRLCGGPANIIWNDKIIAIARPNEATVKNILELSGQLQK